MNSFFNLILFLLIVVFGVGIEMILSKMYFKSHGKHQVVHFKVSRYLFLLCVPMVGIILMSYLVGLSVWKFFFIFMVLGTTLEYCIGFSYKVIVGQMLWKYNKYTINGYTSLLAVPLWGLCGVLVYLLVKSFN
jgi:hypothetical protein